MSRDRVIAAEQAAFPIALLCRVLEVSRSGSDAWRARAASARARADAALTEQVRAVHARSRGPYGAPRVRAQLRAQGVRVGRKRVARLLRAAHLTGVRRGGRRPRTTIADAARAAAPNRIARDFRADAPNERWVADLTSLPTGEGWLSLAVVLDAHSRRVVGWAMDAAMPTALPLAALRMALARPPAAGRVHHADRGCQDTAAASRAELASHGLVASMSRTGDCDDNARAERCFATLKRELVDRTTRATRRQARQAVFAWSDVFYNRQRLHSALGDQTPHAFEERTVPVPIAA